MAHGGAHAPIAGGARRKQFHMLHSQKGVDPRQNQVIDSTETIQQKPGMATGAGMGYRDQSVRMEHRNRARERAIEDPRYSQWRGSDPVVGGNWFSDAFAKVKNEFVNPESKLRSEIAPKLVKEAVKAARPHVESLGNQLGKHVGVENLGTYADKGLKMVGQGRQGRKRVTKMGRAELARARASNSAYAHNGQWWLNDKPMSVDEMNRHKMSGGSFWDTLKSVGRKAVAPLGNALGSIVGVPLAGTFADEGLKMAGYGKKGGRKTSAKTSESDSESDGAEVEGGAKGSDGRARRNAIVRKVMAEKGLKMIAASKYVKEHGLY